MLLLFHLYPSVSLNYLFKANNKNTKENWTYFANRSIFNPEYSR